jgi:hypothetical protein
VEQQSLSPLVEQDSPSSTSTAIPLGKSSNPSQDQEDQDLWDLFQETLPHFEANDVHLNLEMGSPNLEPNVAHPYFSL